MPNEVTLVQEAGKLVLLGGVVAAIGVAAFRSSVRAFRDPVGTTEARRRNLEARGVPRYTVWVPRDARNWAGMVRWSAAWGAVFGAVLALAGFTGFAVGLYLELMR
ncbi:hypothetical protein [Anaeromyxobacter dehalogenans]|nr:hypothetical protein [Anaeromyxobacter dehalogenans]